MKNALYVYIKSMYVYRCEKISKMHSYVVIHGYPRTIYFTVACCLTEHSQIIFCRSEYRKLINKTNLESTREEHVFSREGNR